MYYYEIKILRIINIWKSDAPDLKYRHRLETIFDKQHKISKIIEIINIRYIEFFFDNIYSVENKNIYEETLFFIETEDWSDAVKGFGYLNINISGVSTNQRHIYNPLHDRVSMCLNILYGRYLARELSYYDYKNPKVNHRPKYNLSRKESNLEVKAFWRIRRFNLMTEFLIMSKIIIESNQLANLEFYYTKTDFLRFWVTISKYKFWNELFIDILIAVLVGNKDFDKILNEFYKSSRFKQSTFKFNSELLVKFRPDTLPIHVQDPLVKGKTLKEELQRVEKVTLNMNINYEAIKSINDRYLEDPNNNNNNITSEHLYLSFKDDEDKQNILEEDTNQFFNEKEKENEKKDDNNQ